VIQGIKQNRMLKANTSVLLLILYVLPFAGCGGGSQSSTNQPITSDLNTVPSIEAVVPSCAPAGEQFVDSVDNQLEIVGFNFVASSVVRWNGTDRPTTLNSHSQGQVLTAQISASDIAAAGTATITVFNPPPGGGSSNSSTFTTTTGADNPVSIAVDPAGKFAYVANIGCYDGAGSYVSMYTINPATGTLASIGPPASSQDFNANSVTVDPFGKFVYVANTGDYFDGYDGSIITYAINATTGALAPIGVISGNCPGLCVPFSVVVEPSGKFAYVPNGDDVTIYSIDPTTGALTSIGGTTVVATSVAVDPTGRFAYVTVPGLPGSTGNVSAYTIEDGVLTSVGTIAAGTYPKAVAVDPTGKFAYVSNLTSEDVSMFTINLTTGGLTSIGTITVGGGSIAIHPSGKFVYVSNRAGSFSTYSINATTGTLTLIGTTGAAGSSIAIHPSGKFAYVTNPGSNSVSMYSIDAATGTFTLIGTIGT
jgi:6-phosphogluconolactonase